MLGIVSALSVEAKMLSDHPGSFQRLSGNATAENNDKTGNILLAVSGTGPEAAKKAAMLLVSKGATSLVSWGCAGALTERLVPGDLLLPQAVMGEDGQILYTDSVCRNRLVQMLPARLKTHAGMFVESSRVVTHPGEKIILAKIAGAVAVDMESAAIGRIAQDKGIPFIIIRTVADTARDVLPEALASAVNNQGKIRMPFLLKTLLRHPGLCLPLIRQGLHFYAAARSLRMLSQETDRLFNLARFD